MADKFKTKSIFASAPTTTRGEHSSIGGDPKGKNFLYVNGNSVFIRDIENPSICDVYIDHKYPTTCAKYSPSGFYVASGDNRGNLRIWDTVNPEHILYREYTPIRGIRDIAWTEDSKRLVVVGEGQETYGAAILVDTGTSVGSISGMTKRANTCDVKQTRPYRVITGADDYKVCFYEGPPFKYNMKLDRHSRFVLSTKFSPDGSLFSTAASDGKCFLHDGKTAEFKLALGDGDKAHNGSIFGVSWSGDSKQLLTVSGDMTAKIWDVETGQAVTEFPLGSNIETDQQVACLWQNNHILSLSLNGNINYLNPSEPSKPIRVIKGHQKAIKTLAVNADKSKVFSGSFDGVTNCWDVSTGNAESIEGNKPKFITQVAFCEDKLSTVGMDDTVRTIDVSTMEFTEGTCSLGSQPQGVARGAGNLAVVAGIEKLTVVRNDATASVLDVAYKATTVDIHPNQSEVAVGADDGQIHIYTLSSDTLQEKKSFMALKGEITMCRYSPDGEHLVAGSSEKFVELWKVQEDYTALKHTSYKHSSRVTDVAWSPDNRHYASTSLDGSVKVWTVEKASPVITKDKLHGCGETRSVQWLDENTLATAGADCCIRISELKL